MKIEKFSDEEVERLSIPDFLNVKFNDNYSIDFIKSKFNIGNNTSLYLISLYAMYYFSNKENREIFKNKLTNNTGLLNIIKKKNFDFYNKIKNNFKESYLVKAYVIILSYQLQKRIYKK